MVQVMVLSLRLRREGRVSCRQPWQTERLQPGPGDLHALGSGGQQRWARGSSQARADRLFTALPTNEQFSARTNPGCQTPLPYSQSKRAGSYFCPDETGTYGRGFS